MKSVIGTGSALERLKKFIPASVQPKFNSVEEWQAWQEAEGRKRSEEIDKQNQRARSEKIFGRAGIQALHRTCSFANYQVSSPEQRQAYSMAKSYAQNFGGGGFASFVFSGAPGTGKNHLAAAIGNYLLAAGHSVLVVTIPDLMLRVRECYDDGQSESSLLNDLCNVDLLVLDEVGIQRGSSGEKVIINQVIDRRLSAMKPVGILSNLNYDELVATLGARVIDRLRMDSGVWVNFDWASYRGKVSHLRAVGGKGAADGK
ncbi:ATP-binding protein [Escherichia coli]|uniref:ATP-binding protein n=1 Tax=Leclercia sp. CFBP8987 TaxID=3096525 RepID=UPI0028DA37C9|nr:ATP-binding protein [Leclercia sp. CFBP8987]ELK1314834.1 ATP-binding protein [Escherichia coli]MDY0920362.1 ATP-binding protein [Leclercia sp. CFBP8987]